eukprot:933277-Amphidinium_carterae.1
MITSAIPKDKNVNCNCDERCQAAHTPLAYDVLAGYLPAPWTSARICSPEGKTTAKSAMYIVIAYSEWLGFA